MTYETFPLIQIPELCYTSLFEALPGNSILVSIDEPKFTILAATPAYLSQTSYTKEDIIGKGVFEVFPGNSDDPQNTGEKDLRASYQHVLVHKVAHELPLQRYDLKNEDGSFTEKYWKASNKPVLSPDGEIAYILHTAEDITGLVMVKKTQEAHQELQTAYAKLRDSETKYRALFDSIDQGFCVFEMIFDEAGKAIDYRFIEVNPMFEHQTGLKDALGKRMREMVPHHDEHWFQIYGRVALSGEPIRFQQGSESLGRWFDLYAFRVGDAKNCQVAVLFADITQRKDDERTLQDSEERFRVMVNAVPQNIWITDAEGRAEFLNQYWCDYCGVPYSPTTASEVAANHVHPEDAPKLMQAFEEAMRKEVPFEVEQRNRSKEGQYRWVLNRGTPYRDPKTGRVSKWFGISVDIHDLKLAEQALRSSEEALEKKVQERTQELEEMNKELKRSNQNLEEFAYAASHDMKEPIRKIHFFTDRLKNRLVDKLDAEDLRSFDRLETGANRMSTLIEDLLTYSHISRGVRNVELVDLNTTLSLVLLDMELIIEEKKASINVENLPIIEGHRRQLQQLFENLLGNALKYSKPDVDPEVRLTSTLIKGSQSELQLTGHIGEKLFHQIEISDNGIGFEDSDAERIFNVFTRLHGMAVYKGTGVGLSIVRKVAENHGGFVWAESKPDRGATFKLLLPAN